MTVYSKLLWCIVWGECFYFLRFSVHDRKTAKEKYCDVQGKHHSIVVYRLPTITLLQGSAVQIPEGEKKLYCSSIWDFEGVDETASRYVSSHHGVPAYGSASKQFNPDLECC